MTTDIETPLTKDARAYVDSYGAVVIEHGDVLFDELFTERHLRRDAVVALLADKLPQVSTAEVQGKLLPFGGANPDVALAMVAALYAGHGIDVHLGTHQVDAGPAFLYTAFTDYGDGEGVVEHYPTREERLAQLRIRAFALSDKDGPDGAFFDALDEGDAVKLIEVALMPTYGQVHLLESARRDDGTYLSEAV